MLSYGFANTFSKPLSQKLGPSRTLFLRGLVICTILAIVSIPTLHYLSHWPVALLAILLGVAGYVPVLAFTHSIKASPLGVVAPIAGTSPLVTLMLSVPLLHVSLHRVQWAALLVVILANILVSLDLRNWRQSRLLHKSSGIPFALLASLGWGIFYFGLVPIAKTLGPWLSALLVEIGVTTAAGVHNKIKGQHLHIRDALQAPVIINSVLICSGTLAFTLGVKYFNVGIVAALSNSTALIATILGVYLFKEKLHNKEKIAAILMVAAIAVVSLK